MNVHLQDNKVFLKLDENLLGKDLLFARHGKGYTHVVWTKYLDQILLEIPRVESLSGIIIPIKDNLTIDKKIVGRFPIIKEKSDDNTFGIDITDLFKKNKIAWYSGFSETPFSDLAIIKEVVNLENEIVIKTEQVILENNSEFTTLADFSFFLLPAPMRPRLFDHRIGYFIEDELSAINHFPKHAKASISRWRLEKKYKNKQISEPITAITFFLAPNIPQKWRPYIEAGVLEWLPAFEAAGFKNAIQVKTLQVWNKNHQINSVNTSVIRWLNKDGIRGQNISGGSNISRVVDLRTGEILKSDINIGSSLEDLSDSYFIRCAPLDKRAQQYPFPDDLMGELIQSVVAHEAGHAFGIKDANYGEYTYPFDKMRDRTWIEEMGHTPSIMTYARHNYLVQPEDHISPGLLIQKVGPTDVYNIIWGYKPFPNINEPYEEWPYLEDKIRQQDSIPWYRYNIANYEKTGPDCSNNVADNDNPIKSAELGLRNMKRVVELLPDVTANEKDNDLLERLYGKTQEFWFKQMQHVMSLIGGYTTYYKSGTQKSAVYAQIPFEIQIKAMEFLDLKAFNAPDWLAHPDFKLKIQYSINQDKISGYQIRLLSEALSPLRIKRLENMELSSNDDVSIKSLQSKLRIGLWRELSQETINIKYYRQEIQCAYISILAEAIIEPKKYANTNPSDGYYLFSEYSKSIFLSELLSLKEDIIKNKSKVSNSATRAHLEICLLTIEKIL
tara:strand:- start:38 stop:2218 length:2181 start_codon:yes stop_codon:yes gene_type:complete